MAKILLVEDNELNRDMLTRRLSRAGHGVISAADGVSGVQLARDGKPQLIIMDLRLPQLSGWDAIKLLRADPATATLPIIALSAHAMDQDRQRALRLGADEYDSKPVDFNRLIEKIEQVLENRAGRSTDDPHLRGNDTLNC